MTPQISLHWPKNTPTLLINKFNWFNRPGHASTFNPNEGIESGQQSGGDPTCLRAAPYQYTNTESSSVSVKRTSESIFPFLPGMGVYFGPALTPKLIGYVLDTSIDSIENYIENFNALFGCCTYIIDNIFLGSSFNASNEDLLDNLKIKRIVNISYDIPNYHNNLDYFYLKMKDDGIDEFNKEQLDNIINFIKKDNNNVLIHCMMGRSRSATVVLYYLIKIHNMTLDESLEYLLSKRYVVNPSLKFIENLKNIIN